MKTSDALTILKRRYIGDDKRLQAELERERLNAEVARQIYDARKRAGLTQRQLADLIGTRQSVISRVENADYGGHTVKMLRNIASALGQELRISFREGKVDSLGGQAGADKGGELGRFVDLAPVREMQKRGWLPKWETPRQLRDCLLAFLGASPRVAAHFRLSLPSKAQESALTCWLAKVEREAERVQAGAFIRTRLEADLPELAKLSAQGRGPVLAVAWLEARGVKCVFARHLGTTYLDGAAMLLDDGIPAIGLTLRRDRLDNFWFTLFHEIAHVVIHEQVLQGSAIVDEKIEQASDSNLEKEADRFAADCWVSPEEWDGFRSKIRGYPRNVDIATFAARHKVSPALVAGRLQHELQRYTHYRPFLGEGTVRAMVRKHLRIF